MQKQDGTRRLLSVALIAAITTLTACGGGSSNAPPPADDGGAGGGDDGGGSGAIDRGGVAIGVISGFGSVIVSGVRYDTDDAQFTIDDEVGTESDLAVGQTVRVTGTRSDDDDSMGVAQLVEYEAEIEGPIDAIDPVANTLSVLGQTVEIRNDTLFDDDVPTGSIAGLMVGDFIEVSGFSGADGTVVATRIELEDDRQEFEVTGQVSNLDTVNFTFTIGGLTVDYSGAILEDFDDGELADGLRVEVEGESFAAGGELIATRVEDESDDDELTEDGDFAELEGLITAFTSPLSFSVNGTPVITSESTVFEGGTPENLGLNVLVEVEGTVDAQGVLVAETVEIESAYNLELEGLVEAVDLPASTLTVLGLTIAVDAETRFEDDSEAEVSRFDLSDLMVGDFVEIVASQDSDSGEITARSVERDDDEDEAEVTVQGFVEAVDVVGRTLTVLGITITGEPDDEDFDEVLNAAMVGDLVEAEGILLADGVLLADEVKFESPEDNDGDDDDDDDDDEEDDDDEDEEDDDEDSEG